MSKVWNAILWIILSIEFIFVAVFTIPNLFGIKPFVVTSGSMIPKYPIGSLIYAQKVGPEQIQVGDSIVFYMKDSNIVATHQVYEINQKERFFRTQGINNTDEKGNIIHDATPVQYNNLIGKPILCVPYLGYINSYITKAPGIYIIIFATVVVIGVSFLLDKKEKE